MDIKQVNVRKMLRPKHIVFIGSESTIRQGIRNSRKINFPGIIYAVHRTLEAIEGIPCYPTIDELPTVPDVAFVAIRAEPAVQLIEQLRNLGVAGTVCYAAGFSEIGNFKLNEKLIKAAGDMALVGPNCYGFINYLDRAPLWPDRFGSNPVEEGVAVISQSGNLSFNITMNDRTVPLAYVLDVGNQAILDIADYIIALCEDPRVKAIGLHIEGLNNVERFIVAAKKASEKQIPIVAFKTGVSELGSELTMSHTSSLAGADDLYDALFKRLNIRRVHSLSAFLESLKLFSVTGTITGRNLGVLTVSGGESAIAADIAALKGFSLPSLTEKQKESIKLQMTGFEHVSNPLDYNTSIWGNKQKLLDTFASFMKEQFDTNLLIIDYLDKENIDVESWDLVISAFIQVAKKAKGKAVVISVLPEGMPAYFREKLVSANIAPLQGITDGFTALHAAINYYERKMCKYEVPTQLVQTVSSHDFSETIVLNEWEGKRKLYSYGLTIPKSKVVTAHDESFVTEDMQAPFAIKGLSSEVVHKTDIGAVALNIQREDVKQTLQQMYENLKDKMGYDMQFLVEEMVSGAVAELNIGIKWDEQFGLALILSMGGELVNLMEDSIPLLLPVTRDEISEALHSLKGIDLLYGFRGRPKGDVDAVIAAAEIIGDFAEVNQDIILEMDVNPLLVLPEGEGVVAVDSFIRMRSNTELDHVKLDEQEEYSV